MKNKLSETETAAAQAGGKAKVATADKKQSDKSWVEKETEEPLPSSDSEKLRLEPNDKKGESDEAPEDFYYGMGGGVNPI